MNFSIKILPLYELHLLVNKLLYGLLKPHFISGVNVTLYIDNICVSVCNIMFLKTFENFTGGVNGIFDINLKCIYL